MPGGFEILGQIRKRDYFHYNILHKDVSQFTAETYCFADGRCSCKQPRCVLYNRNQHNEEISKKYRSVRPSVRPPVSNSNKKPISPLLKGE